MKFLLVAIAALLAAAPAGAANSPSQVATAATGVPVSVTVGVANPTTEALTQVSERHIILRPWIAKAIAAFNPHKTPWAVEIFTHEIGHIATGPQDSENSAACWAKANIYRVARLLGFGPHQAKVIRKTTFGDNWVYCT